MEAVENIRDTNWIKFSSNYENCWNTKDYNPLCIGGSVNTISGSNVLVQSGTLWTLSGITAPLALDTNYSGYSNQFPIFLDSSGLTTNSSSVARCNSSKTTLCRTIFTREIQISYPSTDHMKVNSIVTWTDPSRSSPYVINLETVLTNWKKKF